MLRAKLTIAAEMLAALASFSAVAQSPAEAQVLAGLNAARAQGVTCPASGRRPVAAPLLPSPAHALAARNQAGYMSSRAGVTHAGAGGTTPRVRAASAGVQAVSVTEIIYMGTGPQAALNWWLASPLHCAILTDARYTHAGAAVVQGSRGTAYVVVLSSQPR
ncbi:CAP domain-containing protein [Deinococcus sp. SDU3-2]|uniref:CAP domain-containing protein n=1 Tax=Deinococcus terrestris TaxID=2651870 RepID=A0A7X1NTK4_9DEIO|nr:CAP domain-containing protein [Deinococcus terrestris]MPY65284.1 CAP domain-containing protein [Deinococcus terrestris]